MASTVVLRVKIDVPLSDDPFAHGKILAEVGPHLEKLKSSLPQDHTYEARVVRRHESGAMRRRRSLNGDTAASAGDRESAEQR